MPHVVGFRSKSQHRKKLCLSLPMSKNLKLKKVIKSFVPEPKKRVVKCSECFRIPMYTHMNLMNILWTCLFPIFISWSHFWIFLDLWYNIEHDYTVRKHQETGQNKTKSRAWRPKATTKAEENFIRVTSLHDRRLTAPNITASLNQCREPPPRQKTCQHPLWEEDTEAGLYGRIAVKKPLLR